LVGDERLDVLALKLAGEKRVAVGLAVGGEEPDGVGIGLDGPGALVLGLQGPPKAAVEDQEVSSWQVTVRRRLLVDDNVPSLGGWSGWLTAACSG
jgi:hypothetical protein